MCNILNIRILNQIIIDLIRAKQQPNQVNKNWSSPKSKLIKIRVRSNKS